MTYAAPLADMRFVLEEVAGIGEIVQLPGYEAASPALVEAILGEAGKLAETVFAPLNQLADRTGSVLENGVVRTPPGFLEAYARYVEGGWNGLTGDPEYGGQGLPLALAAPVIEMWNSACMSFALCPLLNLGAVELLQSHGSTEQKRLHLGKLVSGEWTGTMNLTEPQAGSDLGSLRTRAMPAGDHYRITGQKIFITYGDHDLECMFTMMNNARLNVGVQGLAIAEHAYQQACEFARVRVQGRPLGAPAEAGALPIIHHPDVRRMLLWMRAATEAMRALAYYAAS